MRRNAFRSAIAIASVSSFGSTFIPATALASQAAVPAVAASTPVRPISDKFKPGNVIVSFEGSVVGDEIGKVLMSLAKGENILPTTSHVFAEGETPCGVMLARGYPLPCSTEVLKLLDELNPKLMPSRGQVHKGATMRVPDVWLRKYRSARSFANSVPKEQTRSAAIKSQWSNLRIGTKSLGASSELVSFNAYELIFFTSNVEAQEKLLSRVMPMKSANVRVTPIGFVVAPAKAYSHRDPSAYQQECSQHAPSKVDYRSDYVESDADAAQLVAQRPARSTNTRVYVVDVAVDPSPNLAGAVEGQSIALSPTGWKCAWVADDERVHATHLAGIIASRDNGYGFVGISPTAVIHSYELVKRDPATGLGIIPEKEAELAFRIIDEIGSEIPHVYLVATSFSKPNDATVIDPERRFDRTLEHNIHEVRPLVVVAAGQPDKPQDNPIPLSPNVPLSPQNLGDQRNVIVVSACEGCTRSDPRLWPKANYTALEGHYVHVAAPGGAPMLGWVNRAGVGALPGTSQAAAFVAGVAAEMLGRWPQSYASADLAKKRLQVTSWPFFARTGNSDYKRVATGIVDVNLALLDPSQHWVKDSSGWRAVRLRGFADQTVTFKLATGVELPIPAKAIARIVRISPPAGPAQYVLYSDFRVRTGEAHRLGEVGRDGPVTLSQPVSLKACDDSTLNLADLSDVIIANRGFGSQPCGG